MAPLAGGAGGFGESSSINPARPPPSNEPEIITIDDDDDEPMNDEELLEVDDGEHIANGVEDEHSDNDSAFNGTDVESSEDMDTPELFTSAGAQEALNPLRRTANRVTRQIEAFAHKLDRFRQKDPRPQDVGSYQAAYKLIRDYQTLTHDAIDELSKQQTLKRAKLGWSSQTSKAGGSGPRSKEDDELMRLQMESETWDLLLSLLSVDDPTSLDNSALAAQHAFRALNRYSSDRQIWEQFLESDHYAMQCAVIMKWLERTADFASQGVDRLITELQSQAGRGHGLWTHGWLDTKEKIKAQKRLRSWPRPLEPNDPGITSSLFHSESKIPLVTQLDPDAVARQKQILEEPDQLYERATWANCWKMLRRGDSWTQIREWAQERMDGWRALTMCGASVDPSACGEVREAPDDSTARMMNFRLQNSWRTACSAVARNPNANDFQHAVFALLCGEEQPAHDVCRSWDDYVYVHLNSVLIARYQGFCKQLQWNLTHSPAAPKPFQPEPAQHDELLGFLLGLRSNHKIASEARNPYRSIHMAIMCKSYDRFFRSLSVSVFHILQGDPRARFVSAPNVPAHLPCDDLSITARDDDAVRITVHLYVMANSLGYVSTDPQSLEITGGIIEGYIGYIDAQDLFHLAPSYASLLPRELCAQALGIVLTKVVDPGERRQQVKLMEKHKIKAEVVLDCQWKHVLGLVASQQRSRTIRHTRKIVTFSNGTRELATVRKDYIGDDVTLADEMLIRSVEWLRYIDGQWGQICSLCALLYRSFYIMGKLASARRLSSVMRLSDISRGMFGFDVAEGVVPVEDGDEVKSPEPASPTKTRLSHRRHRSSGSMSTRIPSSSNPEVLFIQSLPMRDLENITVAFDALEKFAVRYNKLAKGRQGRDSGTSKRYERKLQEALDMVNLCMDQVLNSEMTQGADGTPKPDVHRAALIDANAELEEAELADIRCNYIPELFLEYHNALYWSGYALGSSNFLQCMNLAIQISDNPQLLQSFVGGRRMQELADATAIASGALVKLGVPRDPQNSGGETYGIWHVEANEERDDEFFDFVRGQREDEG